MPLDDNQQAQFSSAADAISTQVANALSMLLNTQVSVNLSDIGEAKTQGEAISIELASVLMTSTLGEASFGELSVLMSSKDAVAVANLMTGAGEEGGEFDASNQEAFSSAINQGLAEGIKQVAGLQDESFALAGFNLKLLDPLDAESLKVEPSEQEKIGLSFSLQSEAGLDVTAFVDLSIDLANAVIMSVEAEAETAEGGEATEAAEGEAAGEVAQSDEETVGDVLGANFAQIVDSHDPEEVDEKRNLNLLMDIRMGLIVELGRAEMHLRDILKLTKGSIIELDRLSGEAVDLFVNNKLIARGEVVVIDDNFGLRITQLSGAGANMSELGLMGADDV